MGMPLLAVAQAVVTGWHLTIEWLLPCLSLSVCRHAFKQNIELKLLPLSKPCNVQVSAEKHLLYKCNIKKSDHEKF